MEQAVGGEIFITKMPVIKIADLAHALIQLKSQSSKIEIREIGANPGEKFYEELMTEEEVPRSVELDRFFMVLPTLAGLYEKVPALELSKNLPSCSRVYNSNYETTMGVDRIIQYLKSNNLLDSVDPIGQQNWL